MTPRTGADLCAFVLVVGGAAVVWTGVAWVALTAIWG
jgi:hypothetical protein